MSSSSEIDDAFEYDTSIWYIHEIIANVPRHIDNLWNGNVRTIVQRHTIGILRSHSHDDMEWSLVQVEIKFIDDRKVWISPWAVRPTWLDLADAATICATRNIAYQTTPKWTRANNNIFGNLNVRVLHQEYYKTVEQQLITSWTSEKKPTSNCTKKNTFVFIHRYQQVILNNHGNVQCISILKTTTSFWVSTCAFCSSLRDPLKCRVLESCSNTLNTEQEQEQCLTSFQHLWLVIPVAPLKAPMIGHSCGSTKCTYDWSFLWLH